MKIKKKFVLMAFLPVVTFLFSAEQVIQLRIPVRAAGHTHHMSELNKDNLTLTVNGKEREIIDLIIRKKTLGQFPDFGRNFVLSFHMTEYNSQVEKGVAYFFTELIHPADSLIVVSPTTIYQLNVSRNKEQMSRNIKLLLEKDCRKYKKDRVTIEKKLRSKIKSLRRILREFKGYRDAEAKGGGSNASYGVRQIHELTRFLDTFPREFIKFRELSLLLDISKYRKIADLMGYREGERWWLHFHREEVAGLLSHIRGFMKELTRYVNDFEGSQSKKVANLEKVLSISDSFPVEQALDTIVSSNFCYNVIASGGRISDQEADETKTSGLPRLLNRMAVGSGGKLVKTIDPVRGVKELVGQEDNYYELVFAFNGKFEKKDLKITAKDLKTSLLYKKGFEKEELESLVRYLTRERITISDFSSKKNLVKFTIKAFERHSDEKFGLLKVNIDLFSAQDEVVYKTHNTLRSSQDEVTVRIPLPEKFRGDFKLRLTVYDLLANRRVSLDRNITL